ncbi:CHY zinc finger protein [Sporosarcina sp. OR05]|uniref:CHY zinc finger protein n=1 Tax=Sporosarcina sp. OR05 TaxID=2969819 RepID=UPI00352A30EA
MLCHGHDVQGSLVDRETRCVHYHSKLDIIAIKFYCCGLHFPCFSCHEESGCGHPAVWPKERFNEKAILCGACGCEMTVEQYMSCHSECPSCRAKFNPGCNLHKAYYFEV